MIFRPPAHHHSFRFVHRTSSSLFVAAMMLSKLGFLGRGNYRCLYSFSSRIRRREVYSAPLETFRSFNGDRDAPSFSRFFSTSEYTKPSHNAQQGRHNTPFHNGRRQEKISHFQIQLLMDESKGFLKLYKTLDAAQRESQLQQLLVSWGPAIKALNNNPKELRQAVQYADSLAHIYLDFLSTTPATNDKNNSNKDSRASASTFINPAIHGFAKIQRLDPHCDAATKAENLLIRLLECFITTKQYSCRPRLNTFNGVLDALSKSAAKDAPQKAREWLNRMVTDKDCVSPDRISLNSVLNAYASRGDAPRATALFDEMTNHPKRGLHPDTYSYNMLMKAWQRSGSPEASSATEKLLVEFMDAYKRRGKKNSFLRPNSSVYSIPMSLANAKTAHKLLDEMVKWHEREPRIGLQPKQYHFAMVMNAYAREGQPEKVEEVFMHMLQLNREGQDHVQPNMKNFCIRIKAWCKQPTEETLKRARVILEQMEELFLSDGGVSLGERLNTYGYNSIMNAYVQSGAKDASVRVQELFERMIRLGQEHSNPEMLPDKISYTTLMKAWIQEEAPGYAERVEQLLKQMNDAYEKEGMMTLKPDVVSYGCAIDAWSRGGDAASVFRAEALLRQMERLSEKGDVTLRPNDFCFNSVINAHSKAGNAQEAESVLQRMEDSYQAGNRRAKPDSVTYTSCIDAWARCRGTVEQDPVLRSQALFDAMLERYKKGDEHSKPTAATFAALMMVLANHKSSNIYGFARKNLQVLQEHDVDLNSIAYNALLYACSREPSKKSDALELAITSYHSMKNQGIPVDSITYKSLLHVVHNLVEGEDERQRALEDVFSRCQHDGVVNDAILNTMQRFGLPTSMKHLMRRKSDDDNER